MARTVIVTGASRGIGREIALEFSKKNYNVVISYAGNDEAAKKAESFCRECGALDVTLFKGDISDENVAENLVKETLEKYGQVDVLVNNAGITRDGLIARMSTEDFDKVISTNLRGAFLMSRFVTKPMMKNRYGRIINISSVVGVHGNPGQANYCASKAGLIGMTKSVAKELASRNITVNAVAPGMIATDMTGALSDAQKENINAQIPAKRMGEPKDIANAVVFLADENSSYITGQVLGVDGGMGA
ncbi:MULTISPECIES: 3-oxoacyl-[acyl-carrier-protein] reductase [unclassified Butyrivibrio]|uniref:3-oxoacyl-[acyl-carrier-protein] reductase n=1 Tax=unclassified Butyrivibrio TaxID=2639466 RepID=UPI0003B5E470|nr:MULTISPECIES: 3-oxoacyl-[acyl-carrier-protein] reductase [unclassified Butyrivibrio]SDB07894.1 3-oxoacyl-[acyl-carrier-protein] reductase [Butyrivibrio sp. INlla16]SEM29195.1 3-oxoacyl-[acyl-carrier-protein] reductase [Butyrivibrio sp. ob235]